MAFYSHFSGDLLQVTPLVMPTGVISATLMVWAYFPASAAGTHAFIELTKSGGGFGPLLISTSTLTLSYSLGDGTAASTSVALPIKTWNHVALVVSSASLTSHTYYGYLNGKMVVQKGSTVSWSGLTWDQLNTGDANDAGACYFRDARAWNWALSGAQVLSEYRSAVPVRKAGLIGWSTGDGSQSLNTCNNATQFVPSEALTVVGGPGVRRRGARFPATRAF